MTVVAHRQASRIVAELTLGRVIDDRSVPRPAWRATTENAVTADILTGFLGGSMRRCVTRKGPAFEIQSERRSVQVVLDGPEAITLQLKKWGPRGLTHHCDGSAFLSPLSVLGNPCGCPPSMVNRRMRARAGIGPQPITTIHGRLAGVFDAGVIRFRSSSWQLAEKLAPVRGGIAAWGRPTQCELLANSREFFVASGRRVSYCEPELNVMSCGLTLAS